MQDGELKTLVEREVLAEAQAHAEELFNHAKL
jgi:hypothetical protein